MALRLFAITLTEGHGLRLEPDLELVPFRELAGVVVEGPFVATEPGGAEIERYHSVMVSLAARHAVLPVPLGVVFRSREALVQWMELHYVALSDALGFVDGRQEARVHISRPDGKPDERGAGADLAAVAAESFRALRRCAVASVPLRTEHVTGIVLSAAFLVDRELWGEFTEAVERERAARAGGDLDIEFTGPWPPYDFVRMQFGG